MDVRPGGIDRTTLGHPGKFSYCLAEDEEDTTWQPLAQMRGIPEGASAVTVMAAMAPRQIMNEWTTDPKEILETFAAEMRANQRHYSIYGGNYAIVIPKQLREHIQGAGWSKRDIAEFIHERARIRRAEWAEVGKGAVVRDRGESVYTALESPDHLLVVAAGGPAGGFGAIIPPWMGHKTKAVTAAIGVCVDCEPFRLEHLTRAVPGFAYAPARLHSNILACPQGTPAQAASVSERRWTSSSLPPFSRWRCSSACSHSPRSAGALRAGVPPMTRTAHGTALELSTLPFSGCSAWSLHSRFPARPRASIPDAT